MRLARRRVVWTSAWGALGLAAILFEAAARLGAHAMRAIGAGLTIAQWSVLAGGAVVMTYIEGYRVFHRREARGVVVRARWSARRLRGARAWAAPLYALGLMGRHRARARRVAAAIVAAIVVVRALPDPWRGIVDAGIVPALAWGGLAIVARYARTLGGWRVARTAFR